MKITEAAAEQIRRAAEQAGAEQMALRIAAMRREDGAVDYMMGFDEPSDEDSEMTFAGVRILVSDLSKDLLKGITLDFVELTPREFQFIFVPPAAGESRRSGSPPEASQKPEGDDAL